LTKILDTIKEKAVSPDLENRGRASREVTLGAAKAASDLFTLSVSLTALPHKIIVDLS
jgi:hypothetical protein